MRQENERSPESRAFLHYIRTGQRVTESFFTEGPPLELKFNPNHDPANGRFASGPAGTRAVSRMRPVAAARRLPSGKLSAKYEAKGDPGRVSSGIGDIGGISYGAFQLSSRNGMAAAFVSSPEARRYAAEFNQLIPGTEAFSAKWRAVAARDPVGFADAQHAFIARENYTRAVRGGSRATGFDIDEHSDTLREVVWSTAAQHGRAPIVISLGALPFLLAGISPPLRDPAILDPVIAETAAYKACLKKAKYDLNAVNLCNLDEYNRRYRVLDTYISKAIKVVR